MTIHEPLYGATFGQAVRLFFRKYADFTGRASRSEFWWAMLFQVIVGTIAGVVLSVVLVLVVIAVVIGADRPGAPETLLAAALWSTVVMVIGLSLISLPLLVPTLAVTVRRLHDTNRSGWWVLISFIPYAGYAIYAFAALESDPAGSRFDPPRASVTPV
ncbi:MAG: DUF805 domain-containing protein [Microcella sp.]